jgi:DNA-binding winged helix-turn-helix (wHTH) protein
MNENGRVRIGEFEIDLDTGELARNGAKVNVPVQPLKILVLLLQRPGELVTREEIEKSVWADTFVDTEHSLNAAIKRLRALLCDDAENPRYIETIPRRGYRFIGAFEPVRAQTRERTSAELPVPESEPSQHSGHFAEPTLPPAPNWQGRTSRERFQRMTVIALLLFAVVLGGSAMIWQVLRRGSVRPPRIAERPLTALAEDNSIDSGSLSRDGKYLLYTDALQNAYLQAIDGGEARQLPWQGVLHAFGWFPDNSHVLLQIGDSNSVWKGSVIDHSARMIFSPVLDHSARRIFSPYVRSAAISPDGSRIALIAKYGQEIWVMGADGEAPRKIADLDGFAYVLAWSPSGRQLAYYMIRPSNSQYRSSIVSTDDQGTHQSVILQSSIGPEWNETLGLTWLGDGRIVYNIWEKGVSELWSVNVDVDTGNPRGAPSFFFSHQDRELRPGDAGGNRLLVVSTTQEHSVEMISSVTQQSVVLTPDRWNNIIDGWTNKGDSLIFESNRSGKWSIFFQDVHNKSVKSILSGSEDYYQAVQTADGNLLFTASESRKDQQGARLMLSAPDGSGSRTFLSGEYQYQCAAHGKGICILGESNRWNEMRFFYLDPQKGKGAEITHFYATPHWALSADGARISVLTRDYADFKIVHLPNGDTATFRLRDASGLLNWLVQDACWSGDNARLYATAISKTHQSGLLAIGPNGEVTVVKQAAAGLFHNPKCSPVGQFVAFNRERWHSDILMLSNF